MTNAVLMASGMGTRLRPLTESTPKPLLTVGGTPMIETVLRALRRVGVDHIYIVVGYLGEQFSYLAREYADVSIIRNPDYETINNISSIYHAREVLTKGNCYICEADLFVSDENLLEPVPSESGYYGKPFSGYSDDWVFEQDASAFISRVGKGGADCHNMAGIAYFTQPDAAKVACMIGERYRTPGYEALFWDDVINENLGSLKLRVFSISASQIQEIDTVEEWEQANAALRHAPATSF